MTLEYAFECLKKMKETGASDLYLTCGAVPTLRINDTFQSVDDVPLSLETVSEIITNLLTPRQMRDFEMRMELNTALDMGAYGRFRVNVYKQRQNPGLVIRQIISRIPTFDELRLPPVMANLSLQKRGLILVTGMTGSGKSTTLASMLNYRNQSQEGHILTVEDPIEYYHEHKRSVITQREVGVDTESYNIALKNALRQRPDVIMIGEIRDAEVMEQALTIAETGHLCLATLHTNNAHQAIERVVNFFPDELHQQIRLNLSMNLKAIVSQRLLPSTTGGQVAALEVLVNQALVRELIQKGIYEKITDVMEQNNGIGMCSFDQSLIDLYAKGLITEQTAINQSDKSSDMVVKLRQKKLGGGNFVEIDTAGLKMSDA